MNNIYSQLIILITFISCHAAVTFHNQFAVHIPGGSNDAQKVKQIAFKHGMNHLGAIGTLKDHFLFEAPKLSKRSTDHCNDHHQRLTDEPDIEWFEQQKELIRTKRDTKAPHDPLFKRQWYLNHGAADGTDMNVQPAWEKGFTGKNVVVTILDDGIQHNHPDLKLNYDPKASYDINGNDDDPMPQDNNDNKHGTRCAGEVAAEAFNNVCGVGIAYNASIGGVRMLDGMVNDAVEATALSLNPQHIDIYSASWGPEDDGRTVDGPGPLTKKAFINGVKQGRNGLGSIFVWASGNGGRKTDNCNCDGYTNSIFTLSISSATQGGRKPWYLEECASTLASTYSSGTPNHDASITTVDQDARLRPNKICTSSHTGTSASAPIAAAIAALALEANPKLSWRDMQHLVVLTSNPHPLLHESGWQINGVGRKYSHKFGYGLMDAAAIVETAQKWPGIGKQFICQSKPMRVDKVISASAEEVTQVSMNFAGCNDNRKQIYYLEHVQCKITLKYNPRGALHIMLTSPSGTRSSLLLPRPLDRLSSDFNDWPFLSTHFWGENPNGTWTLEVVRSSEVPVPTNPRGILKEWKLFFYGTKQYPVEIKIKGENYYEYPEPSGDSIGEEIDNQELPNTGDHVHRKDIMKILLKENSKIDSHGCNIECASGCTGSRPDQCNNGQCKQFSFNGMCINKCPLFTFTTVNNLCQMCDSKCQSCFGPLSNQCHSCIPGYSLILDEATCVKSCPSGYHHERGICKACAENCKSCHSYLEYDYDDNVDADKNNPEKSICSACSGDLYLFSANETCLNSCTSGYFADKKSRICKKCHKNCLTCTGPLETQCSVCRTGTYFYERKCVTHCPPTTIADETIHECVSCPNGCSKCTKTGKCRKCSENWLLNQTTSLCNPLDNSQCPSGFYGRDLGNCQPCHKSCSSCDGRKSDNCLSCQPGHYLHISTCVDQCPSSTFAYQNECRHCPHACKECSNLDNCNTCQAGYAHSLNGTNCVAGCQDNEYLSNGSCHRCNTTCKTCKDASNQACLSCPSGNYLINGNCLQHCPDGTYADIHSSSCLPCSPSCQTCFNKGPKSCKTCPQGLKLIMNTCVSCKIGQYFDSQSFQCQPCASHCLTCWGGSSEQCTSCKAPTSLDPWSNTCVLCCDDYKMLSQTSGPTQCCLCNEQRTRCLQYARTYKRSSLGHHLSTPSTSLLLTGSLITLAALVVIFIIRKKGKMWKRKQLHNNSTKLNKHRNGRTQKKQSNGFSYTQISIHDDIEDVDEDLELLANHD